MNEKNNINEVNDLLLGGDGAANVLEKLAETMKTDLITDAMRMNDQAMQKDPLWNRVSYGCTTQTAKVLRALCYDVEVTVEIDGDFLICEKITINDRVVFER